MNDTKLVYDSIVKELKQYTQSELIKDILKYIHNYEQNVPEDDYRLQRPWAVLNLLKLTFLFCTGNKTKKASYPQFIGLLKKCIQLSEFVPNDLDKTSYTQQSIFRSIAYQQFWVQERLSYRDIGRYMYIFSLLPVDSRLNEYFIKQTGVDFSSFFKFSVLIWLWIKTQKRPLYLDLNDISAATPNSKALNIIANYLTIDYKNVKKELLKLRQVKSDRLQAYEQTPFLRYPFIRFDRKIWIVSIKALEHAIKNLPIQIVKQSNDQQMIKQFTSLTEKYTECLLSSLKVNYQPEHYFKSQIPSNQKIVDFIVETSRANIFIEIKTALPSEISHIYAKPKVLINTYSDTVISALIQGFQFARFFLKGFLKKYHIFGKKANYLLIVTLNPLYLGHFDECWHYFLREGAVKKDRDLINIFDFFDINNIFFVTYADLEWLLSASKNPRYKIDKILKKISRKSKRKSDRLFDFGYYLDDIITENINIDLPDKMFSNLYEEIKFDICKRKKGNN